MDTTINGKGAITIDHPNGNEGAQYTWLGEVWTLVQDARDRDQDKVVSKIGHVRPLSDLLLALYKHEAHESKADAFDVPTPPPTPMPSKAGELDTFGRDRAAAKIAHAKAQGVTLPSSQADGLFFDLGTAVEEGAWTSERQTFEKLPTGENALPKLRDAITAEERETITIKAWDVRMSRTTGKLGDPSDPTRAARPTRRAFQSFCQRAKVGAIPDHWPTDIVASALNQVTTRFTTTRPGLTASDPDPQVVFRVQRSRARIFACVSPSYTPFDGDLVMEALLQALPQGSRVNVDYDPDGARGKVEIVTLQEERPVVGEPFRTSFTVGWDDTGSGSIWGDGGLFSARCLNLTRIYTSTGAFRIRHVGSVRRLAYKFRSEFDRVARVVAGFSKAYGHAAGEELTNEERIEGTAFLQGLYRSLIQRDLVPVRGRREDAIKDLALQAMADENKAGLTRAGVANGITRYAHRVNTDPWVRDDMERAAGRILWSPKPIKLDYLAQETNA